MTLVWNIGPNTRLTATGRAGWQYWVAGPTCHGELWRWGRDRWSHSEYEGALLGVAESAREAYAACEAYEDRAHGSD